MGLAFQSGLVLGPVHLSPLPGHPARKGQLCGPGFLPPRHCHLPVKAVQALG